MATSHFKLPTILTAARRSRSLTQRELAAAAGMQASVINRLERGHRGPPSSDTLERIAKALQLEQGAVKDLLLAQAHDRVLATLEGTPFQGGAELISSALVAIPLMSENDISALAWHIVDLSRSRRFIASLRDKQREEAAMR